jgi:hypothetical protein
MCSSTRRVRRLKAKPRLRWLYWFAVGSALFACASISISSFPRRAGYGPQFVWLDSGVFRRAQGFFYEASTLGNFCVFFLVMIAVALVRPRGESPVSRKALLAGGAVFFAALVLSYSRASVVSLVIAGIVLGWLHRKRLRFARVAGVLSLLLCGGVLLMWKVFPTFAETYWMRLSATGQYLFTATEGLLSGRVASWRTLASWIEANPWQALLGSATRPCPIPIISARRW